MFNHRDILLSVPIINLGNWVFDEKVAEVFQDMIHRSIPGYYNIISTIGKLAKYFVHPGTQVYDLGCSLSAVAISIIRNIHHNDYNVIAVDNSTAMIKRCRQYINLYKLPISVEIIENDIRNIKIENASMVVLNFTLQFLSIDDRQILLNKIYRGLNPGGILILSEKFSFDDSIVSKLLSNMHHSFKLANGYSKLEIIQKQNMLERVMLIDSIKTHKTRLLKAGFSHSELWFQCFNFGSLIALKNGDLLDRF